MWEGKQVVKKAVLKFGNPSSRTTGIKPKENATD